MAEDTTTGNEWDGLGYSVSASIGGGIWLRLKQKGDKVRLRIVSSCCRFTDVYDDKKTGETNIRKKAAWLVIHKEPGQDGKAKTVKVFVGGPMIYGAIKELDESEDWGDPSNYDITVERTEEAGRYYVVTPLPKPTPGPISEADQKLVVDADIEWPAVCVQRKGTVAVEKAAPPAEEDPFGDE